MIVLVVALMLIGAFASFMCVMTFFAFVNAGPNQRALPSVHTDLPIVIVSFFVIAFITLWFAAAILSRIT